MEVMKSMEEITKMTKAMEDLGILGKEQMSCADLPWDVPEKRIHTLYKEFVEHESQDIDCAVELDMTDEEMAVFGFFVGIQLSTIHGDRAVASLGKEYLGTFMEIVEILVKARSMNQFFLSLLAYSGTKLEIYHNFIAAVFVLNGDGHIGKFVMMRKLAEDLRHSGLADALRGGGES